jgi:hypothetical protein
VEAEPWFGGLSLDIAFARVLRAGLGGGAMLLHGRGLSAPTRSKAWAAEPVVYVLLGARLFVRGPWSLEWGLRAHWAPQPGGLVVRGFGTVYRSESFGFQVGPVLGFAIR